MAATQQLALVSQTRLISRSELTRAAAALQKQLTRDFGPAWGLAVRIDAFRRLEDVPPAAWPVLVRDDVDAAGIHLDEKGHPFALVDYSDAWTLTASHEALEMSADPFGNRLMEARAVKAGQGLVQYLVEVCDPCEAPELAYLVDGVLVSDFYTPRYFDPAPRAGVRYSATGAITRPRQVLRGGYLSWRVPATGDWWQELWLDGDRPTFRNLGPLGERRGSPREQVDRLTAVEALA